MYIYNEDDDRRMAAEYAARHQYTEGYEQGKKDARNVQWTPVSERLPEENVAVLIFLKNGSFAVGYQRKEMRQTVWRSRWSNLRLFDMPTHWTALPEAPKEAAE